MNFDKLSILAITTLVSTANTILHFLFGWLPSIPSIDVNVQKQIFSFFDYPFTSGAMGFIGWIFGGWTILSLVFISALSVYIFRISYDSIMLILTKIPVLGAKR